MGKSKKKNNAKRSQKNTKAKVQPIKKTVDVKIKVEDAKIGRAHV